MTKKGKTIIIRKMIEIKGSLSRHKIVKKVVNTFIKTEYYKKGRGVIFKYPVENLPEGQLFIGRPGHKKNFDFKVEILEDYGIGKGGHIEIALDLKGKKQENQQKFEDLFGAITKIYDCSQNEVNKLLEDYSDINNSFVTGAKTEVLLNVIKWLFIMEDIVYWDNEGRAFLFNFFKYVVEETDNDRLTKVFEKVNSRFGLTPDQLKSFTKKCNIEWIPYQGKL